MTRDIWSEILEKRLSEIVNTLNNKSKEYASEKDVMHNFKRAATIADCTPERALFGFMLKHFTSVLDLIDNLDKFKTPSEELVNEKLGDLINYCILLEGLLKERIENNKPVNLV